MRFIVPLFSVLALMPFAAAAQDAAAPTQQPVEIALGVDHGAVLVSTGGEFASPVPGQVLSAGDRVLVPEGGSARLNYANGCQQALSAAGVYTVSSTCVTTVGTPRTGPSAGVIAGTVAGVAAVAAAASGGGDSRPVSR